MANTQIIIEATDTTGNPVNKTIKNINPAATNAQLATFGTMLNSLTDNTYGKTTKITKVHCDAEAGGGDTRPTPTLQFWNSDQTAQITETNKQTSAQAQGEFLKIKYDGDAQLLFGANIAGCYVRSESEFSADYFMEIILSLKANTPAGTDVVFTVKATETENYKAAEAQFTVHITA